MSEKIVEISEESLMWIDERYNRLREENKRLNNIINELEKYCIEEIEDYSKEIKSQYITDIAREQYEGEKVCFEDLELLECKTENLNFKECKFKNCIQKNELPFYSRERKYENN